MWEVFEKSIKLTQSHWKFKIKKLFGPLSTFSLICSKSFICKPLNVMTIFFLYIENLPHVYESAWTLLVIFSKSSLIYA